MTAGNPDSWSAPNYTRFTGSDATSLQQTFASLSNYLEKINNSVTIASGAGVLSLTGTTNQITVSASTGAVTLSFPTNLSLSGDVFVPANGKIIDSASLNYFTPKDQYGNMYHKLTSGSFFVDANNYYFRNQAATNLLTIDVNGNSSNRGQVTAYTATRSITLGTWAPDTNWGAVTSLNGYLLMGHFSDKNIYLRTQHASNVNIGGNGNNTLVVGTGSADVNGGFRGTSFAAFGGTGLTEGVSTPSWFRSTGDTGWYNQSYGGGWHMSDSTWIRSYNNKNVYMSGEVRSGNVFSGNVGRVRGSYGAVSFGANGITNSWDGIEFQAPTTQTFMVQNDNYSGMYRANSTWNWLWSYNTLVVGSDVRFKRDIQPLNVGLNFIEKLEPISYLKLTESCDDDPEATENGYYYGFSAQNVRAALDACGETRNVKIHDIGGPNMGLIACTEDAVYDRQYLGVTEFMGPVVQAIKELNDRIKLLESNI